MTRVRDGLFQDFLSDESGAVSSEMVVVAAIVVGLGLAAVVAVSSGAQGLTERMSSDVGSVTRFTPVRSLVSPPPATELANSAQALAPGTVVNLYQIYANPDMRTVTELSEYVSYWSSVATGATSGGSGASDDSAEEDEPVQDPQVLAEARDHLMIALAALEARGLEIEDLDLADFDPADYDIDSIVVFTND
ncbi:hypothetical protein HKCCE2091_07245 [Rhodobacterales bacterium HKCCE2091]|nr:hypothetical protein [Rhodobacterales bacterium HKCCE2091]